MQLSLAFAVPSEIHDDLSLLKGSLDDIQWIPRQKSIIPFYSIGHIESHSLLEELDIILNTLRWEPHTIQLSEVFHRHHTHYDSLTVGITPQAPLKSLHKRVKNLFKRHDFPIPFTPRSSYDLTIGHLETASPLEIAPWIQRNNLFQSSEFTLDHLCLIETHFIDNHPSHTLLERYPAHEGVYLNDDMFKESLSEI